MIVFFSVATISNNIISRRKETKNKHGLDQTSINLQS